MEPHFKNLSKAEEVVEIDKLEKWPIKSRKYEIKQ